MPGVNALLTKVLGTYNIGYEDYRTQTHEMPFTHPLYMRSWPPVGIVMHYTEGMIDMKNLVTTWLTKSPMPPSHLCITSTGKVGYFVSLDYADRATENTNKHISIEFQAAKNSDITDAQIHTASLIYAFLHNVYDMPFAEASSRGEKGLSHHAVFVDASNPDGHATCPGPAIIARKPAIIARAKAYVHQLNMGTTAHGSWWVRVPGSLYTYKFGDGSVSWLDVANGMKGAGTWKQDSKSGEVRITWDKSKTIEKWTTVTATAASGTVTYEGESPIQLTATRKTDD
jgi:hypothetical protein